VSLRVEWTPNAERGVRAILSWRVAADVCEAVLAFASTGVGRVVHVRGRDFDLHVAGHSARIEVDGDRLIVWAVWPNRAA
jgi:hypothetical protein